MKQKNSLQFVSKVISKASLFVLTDRQIPGNSWDIRLNDIRKVRTKKYTYRYALQAPILR